LATLSHDDVEPATRIEAYRAKVNRASVLLERSLARLPAQPEALAKLAALRFEMAAHRDEDEAASILRAVDAASSMAPRVAEVQLRLGDLLLRMGRDSDAAPYLRRAVELEHTTAQEAVATLRRYGARASAIAEQLPSDPAVLAALAGPYAEDGDD